MTKEINGFKQGDNAYLLQNPEIVPDGYIKLKIIRLGNHLVACNPKNIDDQTYRVDAWTRGKNPRLKKTLKELGNIITEDDIHCKCCERYYDV